MHETVLGAGDPIVEWDLSRYAEDRGEFWERWRSAGPVVMAGSCPYVTRRDDALAVLRDHRTFSSHRTFNESGATMIPIGLDAPKHLRCRRKLVPLFSPGALAAIEPTLRKHAATLINAAIRQGHCDGMSDIAIPFACQSLLTACGIPNADGEKLLTLNEANNTHQAHAEAAIFAFLSDAVQSQLRCPTALLTTLLLSDDPMELADLVNFLHVVTVGAIESVASTIGFTLLWLANHPPLRNHLRAHPDQIGVFVEEVLRLEPPVPFISRATGRSVTIAGTMLPAGMQV